MKRDFWMWLRPTMIDLRHGIARIKYVAFFGVLLTVLSSVLAMAEERVDICARYSATGASYHVNAISTTGFELNQATRSFNYNGLSRYIVIFWAQNQATVIEMTAPFFGPSYIQSSGTDQEGRSWGISAYSPVWCQQ